MQADFSTHDESVATPSRDTQPQVVCGGAAPNYCREPRREELEHVPSLIEDEDEERMQMKVGLYAIDAASELSCQAEEGCPIGDAIVIIGVRRKSSVSVSA